LNHTNYPTLPTVIVVAFRSGPYLSTCLDALAKTAGGPPTVIVVDNACPDNSTQGLESRFPALTVLRNASNEGFAAGANRGIAAALSGGANDVVLLNPDTIPDAGWLNALSVTAQDRGDAGIIGALLLDHDGAHLDSWQRDLLMLAAPGSLATIRDGTAPPVEVPTVIGAAMWIRRSVLHEVGALDPIFFSYGEDTDLCRRARARGFRMLLVPGARVRHKGQGSSRGFTLRWRTRWLRARNDGLLLLKRPNVRVRVSLFDLAIRTVARGLEDVRRGRFDTALLRCATLPAVVARIPGVRRSRKSEALPWAHLPKSFSPLAPALQGDRSELSAYSSLYRNPLQLKVLFDHVFPRVSDGDKPILIAVHACSSGMEPHTIAAEWVRRRPSWRLRIHAFDRERELVAKGRRGLIASGEVERAQERTKMDLAALFPPAPAPAQDRLRTVLPEAAAMVQFAMSDLLDPVDSSSVARYQVVCCQNVLVHLEPECEERALRNVAQQVSSGGWLIAAGRGPRSNAVLKELGFRSLNVDIRGIHEAFIECRTPWDSATREGRQPPYWALPPVDASQPDWELRFGTIFRRGLDPDGNQAR
jgi:GT2 family glycosyltransferase/chemotaxis methyl-accepting protein methylase